MLLYCVHFAFMLIQARLQLSYSRKGSRLGMTRNSDANGTCQAEAVTKEAKWSVVDIRQRIFQSGAPIKRSCLAYLVRGAPVGFRTSPPPHVLQERLRSSWVPTSILLYSFCCSSLKVSFTLARFNPPSLQMILKLVRDIDSMDN